MNQTVLDRECLKLAAQCQAASPARLKHELLALTDLCNEVQISAANRQIILREFPFPPGWNRRTATVMYRLPPTYAQEQPDAYLEEDLRYHGERPMIMLRGDLPGYSKHCIHHFADEWRPHHTIVTMMKMIKQSFRYPNKKDPWKNYR